jgi:hypothetical protein
MYRQAYDKRFYLFIQSKDCGIFQPLSLPPITCESYGAVWRSQPWFASAAMLMQVVQISLLKAVGVSAAR